MAKFNWSEKVQQAYDLLIEDAKLDKAKVRELVVTFPLQGSVSYRVEGLIVPDNPPSLDMGTSQCP